MKDILSHCRSSFFKQLEPGQLEEKRVPNDPDGLNLWEGCPL